MSWGGRGIEDETRERMIDAARRSGMSVSELVQALAGNSPTNAPQDRGARRDPRDRDRDFDRYDRTDRDADRYDRAPERRGGRAERDTPVDLDHQLDALAERLKSLSATRIAEPAAPRGRTRDRVQDTTLEEIAATVDRLSRQVPEPAPKRAAAKAKPQTDVTAILAALDGLDRRVKAMADERVQAPAPTPAKARRERSALGDLDRTIAEIAQRQSALEREKRPRRAAPATGGDDIDRHFRELTAKIEQLRQRDETNSPAALIEEIRSLRQFIEQSAGAGVDVSGEIRKLTTKIDELATLHPERATIEPLMTEMGRLRDVVLQADVEGSLKSLEAGYGHIVDRLDDLKRGLASPRVEAKVDAEISEIHNLLRAVPQVSQFSSIEQSLRELAAKVERLASEDQDPHASRLERRIGELKSQIERIDPGTVVKALDQRLKLVTDKLDAIEKATRGPVSPDRIVGLLDEMRTLAAGSRSTDDLRALELRLGEISDRIADLDRRRPSFDDTDRLHDRIADIAGKIDRLAAPSGDRRTVDALEATIARLDELMARQSIVAPSNAVDPRVAELIDRLDRGQTTPATKEIDALGREIAAMRAELTKSRSTVDLEAQMRTLAERLERTQTHEPDDDALSQIEEQLATISSQLEANEFRFEGLTRIEGSVRRLGERLDDHQAETIEAAREAAREMVREIGQNRGEGGVTEGVLRALQQDLKSLQSAARDTEDRTNGTLISLHDALTGIVGRLSAIEKIAQSSARAGSGRAAAADAPSPMVASPAVTAPAAMAPVAVRAPAPQPAAAAAPVAATPAQPMPGGGVASAIARARESLSAAAEDTRPLEPGSGKPTPRAATVTPPSATMTPTTVETAPPPAAAPAGEQSPAAARKADFIAAARRAAQAAATATAAPTPLTARAEDRAATVTAEAEDATGGSALSRIGQVLKNRRRPLVLATGALVLAILTLRLIPGGGESRLQEAAETPKPEAQQSAVTTAPAAVADAAPATTAVPQTTPGPTMTEAAPAAPAAQAPIAPTAAAPAPAAQPQASIPAAATTTPVPASQRTSALSRPMPDASLLDAPATTGSVAPSDAARPAAAAESSLPAKIGSDRLRRAADAGDPKAAFEVGMRFAEGRGVPADPKAAAEWYARAAEAGMVPAQYRYAVALEKGIGVNRDSEQARRWYLLAAEKGNVRAMHNLGVLYANGRDIASALPWFEKAADLGLKDSQFNLGIIHALGSGVKQDLAVSYKWFALAARQGDKEAEKKQADITAHLDKVNLAAAKMAVQTWVQKPLDRETNEELQVWVEPKDAPKAAAVGERDMVLKVQSLLQSRGIYSGPLDGTLTPKTRTAIKTFQKKAGQAQTGEVDGNLLQLLAGKAL